MEKKFSKRIVKSENKEYFLSNLHGSIDNIVKDIKLIEGRVKELVVDKDISLDERWILFCKFATECNRGKCHSAYSFENKNFQKYLDNREFNNNEEVDVDWELDQYFEWFADDEGVLEENLNKDIIEVKEECLENFIYSYYNCW